MLSGLFYLKVKNVLHRDLKVANLLLNREGILRIADFGTPPFVDLVSVSCPVLAGLGCCWVFPESPLPCPSPHCSPFQA
jgi:serine/threonine protein kinase